jgi:hypothetical protein
MLQLRISLLNQRLDVISGPEVIAIYPVSTAARGGGERNGSYQTPRGRHQVQEKIGADAALGAVFVARKPTGEICTQDLCRALPDRDWILTRILWLSGLEPGRNLGGKVDTYSRYIYIHGTPDTEPMGVPRSHGCIRMRNADIAELYELVNVGTEVVIEDAPEQGCAED